MAFARESDAIAFAARTLAGDYLPEGRDTLATIGAKWAPLGAANDPGGLNASWTTGVGTYYAALGGDPARPCAPRARTTVRPARAAPRSAPSPRPSRAGRRW